MPAAFDPTRVDWNLLRAFVAVVEQGSLTRAATQLGSSQPTLSRQITALEAAVGAPLFERGTRRMVPTSQGRAMAEPAARMVAAALACAQAAAAPAEQLAGTVRITASEVVAAHVLPRILRVLNRRHPEIQIELVASDKLGNLLEREADIAVRMVTPTQDSGALIARHLADWPMGLFVHRTLLAELGINAVEVTTLQQLAPLPKLGFDQSTLMIDGFKRAGVTVDRRHFGFRCDHQLVNFEALRAGLGMGVALVGLAAQDPQLVRVLPDLAAPALPSLPVWLTAHRELRHSLRLRVVFDFLADALKPWPAEAPA